MRVRVHFSGRTCDEEGQNLSQILKAMGTNIESIIILKEGKMTLEEEISDGDTIELVNVASGG
jgi:sulfur carrier protein ThiS